MMNKLRSSVSRRRSLVIWTLFCVIAGATFLAYAFSSLANGHGEFVMPLDDVYIHFQYARQMAAGQPYIYNPGLPPTSGATSFLYPYVLAIGYLIGFQGLNLGIWAMGVGALALVCAMWLVYKLVRLSGTDEWLAVLVAAAFGANGAIGWHFMSGMETGLVVLLTLGTLYAVIKVMHREAANQPRSIVEVVVWATALALIRPEGGLLAVMAVGVILWGWRQKRGFGSSESVNGGFARSGFANGGFASGKPLQRWTRAGLIIPVLAVGVQPLVNWVLTGSAVASGNAAKSILGTVPFYGDEVIRRIVGNLVQMWLEFGTGISPREGLYIMPLLLLLAVVGIGYLLIKRQLRSIGVMLVLWLISGTAMLATLDTVFWHFKRYQMPFIALLFPLAGWGIGVAARYQWRRIQPPSRQERQDQYGESGEEIPFELPSTNETASCSEPTPQPPPASEGGSRSIRLNNSIKAKWLLVVIVAVMLVVAASTSVQFWRYYGLNVGYVYAQPLQMARWLQANTPDNAVVAVHDVGMMRYMGGRTTLDMVGLTTKGAADYWRNGPGAVAEFLMKEKPDYIASYGHGHGFGLGMIADTDIYGKPLASFPVELDSHANVALAADFQGIYQPDWNRIDDANRVIQSTIVSYLGHLTRILPMKPTLDENYTINVGNLDSERSGWINYEWKNTRDTIGFQTEVRQMIYEGCVSGCRLIVDGGRQITGEEQLTFKGLGFDSSDVSDLILVTRVHPEFSGTIDIYLDCAENSSHIWSFLARRWIPEIPGRWLEIASLVRNHSGCSPIFRIVPDVKNRAYFPFHHWIYQGHYMPETLAQSPISTFQDGTIQLGSATLDYQAEAAKLGVHFEWYTDGSAKGDYKVFVHLYADKNSPPVAQLDMRPGNGTLPPGNWLPGVLRDTITVDLTGVPPGSYQVAIGMYDPVSLERLQPTGGDEQGRLFIGGVEIKG